MSAPVVAPPKLPRLPDGLRMSSWWIGPDGTPVQGDVEVPVDKDLRIAALLLACPAAGCQVAEWQVPDGSGQARFCPDHGGRLVDLRPDAGDADPVAAARVRLAGRVRLALMARRDRAVAVAQERAAAAQRAAVEAGQRRWADVCGHAPSIGGAASVVVAGVVMGVSRPVPALLLGLLLLAVSPVVFVAAHVVCHRRVVAEVEDAERSGPADVSPKRWARWFARSEQSSRGRALVDSATVSGAVAGTGVWLWTCVAVTAVVPLSLAVVVLVPVGSAGSWVVCRRYWERLWWVRADSLRRAREAAEAHARRVAAEAEEAVAAAEPVGDSVVDESDPVQVGLRFAQRWRDAAAAANELRGAVGFAMDRTWIVPEETKPVTMPGSDAPVGWEFLICSEPGVLVARVGAQPPIVAAREWLAAVLFPDRDRSMVTTVDRPDGLPNRAALLVTDGVALGPVVWKGRAGVRVDKSGVISAHVGRTLPSAASKGGEDVSEVLFTPGQAGGKLAVGHTGSGKTYGDILDILNWLAAGIFPVLHDPKMLIDLMDFIGVFPIGVTTEHRDVIIRSLVAERVRRETHIGTIPSVDRHGRRRQGAAVWNVERDGPVIGHSWQEFHIHVDDKPFMFQFATHLRLQRTAAMFATASSQAGGLSDWGDSVVRGLLATAGLRVFRTQSSLARLAGYKGLTDPESLPRTPGACLTVQGEGAEIPMQMAYVTRDDCDGSVFDQLYAPDGSPLLAAPELPAETVAVFEREGLMDLWRLGQGPNGPANVLSESASSTSVVNGAGNTTAVGAGQGKVPVSEVILAVAVAEPGHSRSEIHAHGVWAKGAGWQKPPVLTTVCRAVSGLAESGLVAVVDQQVRVTDRGRERARVAAVRCGLLHVDRGEEEAMERQMMMEMEGES